MKTHSSSGKTLSSLKSRKRYLRVSAVHTVKHACGETGGESEGSLVKLWEANADCSMHMGSVCLSAHTCDMRHGS